VDNIWWHGRRHGGGRVRVAIWWHGRRRVGDRARLALSGRVTTLLSEASVRMVDATSHMATLYGKGVGREDIKRDVEDRK